MRLQLCMMPPPLLMVGLASSLAATSSPSSCATNGSSRLRRLSDDLPDLSCFTRAIISRMCHHLLRTAGTGFGLTPGQLLRNDTTARRLNIGRIRFETTCDLITIQLRPASENYTKPTMV
jgi:hypothetical protein